MKKSLKLIILILCIQAAGLMFSLHAYADELPLYTFDYGGKHIETYVTYSIIDGEKSTSHRYYVKSGNLVVIDQNLNTTANDIFIYFNEGKSYIAVLKRDGSIVSLGTERITSYLSDFKNKNIKALAENITNDSTTMLFTYEDGSHVAYDCITGEKLYETEKTEKKASSGIIGYAREYVEDFISGGNINSDGVTAAARAQGIINTLEASGKTLDIFVESGALEGIAADYSGGIGNADYSGAYIYEEYTGDYELADYDGGQEAEFDIGEYDFSDNRDYIDLINSDEEQWSDEAVEKLNNLINRIAAGEITAAQASEKLAFIQKEDNGEASKAELSEDMDTVEDIIILAVEDEEKITRTISNVEKVLGSIEAESKELREEAEKKEKKKTEKEFISSKLKNKYVAVYNAKEKRYDIYSQEGILENPQNPLSATASFSDSVQNDFKEILADNLDSALNNGVILFAGISGAIIFLMLSMIILFAKIRKKKAFTI